MGDLAYRSEQVGVRLVNRGSTFWSRFPVSLRASKGLIIAYVGAVLAIALVLLGGAGIMVRASPAFDDTESGVWYATGASILVATLGIGLATMFGTVAFRSLSPDPAERLLPRELHLFEDRVMVVPFEGAAFQTPWAAYVLGATETSSGVTLLLGREPRLEFHVRRRALPAREWSMLRRWLEAQGLLR